MEGVKNLSSILYLSLSSHKNHIRAIWLITNGESTQKFRCYQGTDQDDGLLWQRYGDAREKKESTRAPTACNGDDGLGNHTLLIHLDFRSRFA